ncbi:rRNA processing protein CgrA [Talaromyces stipitatus ATCC 10500]|uniref:rRNA-processing protein n=1 Tax=Talaromyces stipitatus (strain ATCC 10500 / CBS 375.48 / QM 6759 / NRRL 1006) TaxID=441959 RepID=B8MG76_TALSN|nr:rRNA processing protein CgrA [Talaromyces stipitatus ATCC 10500]EED15943.1 rRNA processing protein CgrA [Talaromyces stipitatus ATCC 10500]
MSAVEVADSGKTAVGMRKNGKNWHTPKKPFRPTAGLKSYEKRLEERNNLAAMKEREKEMKEEKEAERQTYPSNQRSKSRQGRKRAIREDGRENAQKTSREEEAEGEEE